MLWWRYINIGSGCECIINTGMKCDAFCGVLGKKRSAAAFETSLTLDTTLAHVRGLLKRSTCNGRSKLPSSHTWLHAVQGGQTGFASARVLHRPPAVSAQCSSTNQSRLMVSLITSPTPKNIMSSSPLAITPCSSACGSFLPRTASIPSSSR